jgi:hypothetical protein
MLHWMRLGWVALFGGSVVLGAAAGTAACSSESAAPPAGGHDGIGGSGASGIGGSGAAGGTTTSSTGSDCTGQTCSGVGTCVMGDGGTPSCECPEGYYDEGLECLPDPPCDLECGYCAHCDVVDGVPQCACPEGWSLMGTDCSPSNEACEGFPCGEGQVCVPAHHCQIDPMCLDTCDCSNCGDCDMDDMVAANGAPMYCGGGTTGPATMACNRPCPGGGTCIPYSTPICYYYGGCVSL